MDVEPRFYRSCPACDGPISVSRLSRGLPCESHDAGENRLETMDPGLIKNPVARKIAIVARELRDFEEFFKRAVGSPPRSVQRLRMKRLLAGMNFSILAPTGMGKSTFSAVAALYYASKSKRVLIVVPTRTLVRQTYERILSMAERIGSKARIVAYRGKQNKQAVLEADFDVLIVTSAFISAHVERGLNLLNVLRSRGEIIDLVIADDVDAILKGSKNVRRILMLIGLKPKALDEAYEAYREGDRERLEAIRGAIMRGSEEYTVGKLGQLVVCTATGIVGRRARELFRLLNFAVGSSREGIRNVIDAYEITEDRKSELKRLAGILKDGILIFVPVGSKGLVEEIRGILSEAGLSSGTDSEADIDAFSRGELNALVGTAYYYGRLVRGIDLPERTKYVIFVGVPKFVIRYGERPSLSAFLALAYAILPALRGREYAELRGRIRRILKRLQYLRLEKRRELSAYLSGEGGESARALGDEIRSLRNEILEALPGLDLSRSSVLVRPGPTVIIPDVRTYIQASGRTSRLYAGGVTKGLSIVLESDEALVDKLIHRSRSVFDLTRYRLEGEELIGPDRRLKLRDVIAAIESERGKLRGPGEFDPVRPLLFVVESPNKARTIARFFGRPGRIRVGGIYAYEVLVGDRLLIVAATGGHVYDLVDEGIRGNNYYGVIYGERVVPEYAPIVYARYKKVSAGYAPGQLQGPCMPTPQEFRRFLRVVEKVYGEKNVDRSIAACLYPIENREEAEERVAFVPKADPSVESGPRKEREESFELEGLVYRRSLVELIDKKSVIDALRRLAFEAEEVYVATDPDVEGEFIGRSVAMAIRPFARLIKRAEFHEVTVKAILEALRNPREIDRNRVLAQIVRRIEDRRIGFGLSKRLQKKYSSRVDSVVSKAYAALREALEALRDSEDLAEGLKAFKRRLANALDKEDRVVLTPGTLYTIATNVAASYVRCIRSLLGSLKREGDPAILEECRVRSRRLLEALRGELEKIARLRVKALSAGRVQTPVLGRIIEAEKRISVVATISGSGESVNVRVEREPKVGSKVSIEVLERERVRMPPMPPYTTDELLRDAARILGFSPEYTMSLAQELFELGLITYHRTDTTRVSDAGLSVAREYIRERFGDEYFRPRRRVSEGFGIQAAHECIRPTRPLDAEDLRVAIHVGDIVSERPLRRDHYRLYDLIFRRFVASQMPEAEAERVKYKVVMGDVEAVLEEFLVPESGRARVRRPAVTIFERLSRGERSVSAVRRIPEYLTEDQVVRLMRERNIGRPSTYARIVQTIKERKYATTIEFGRLKALKPTKRGKTIYSDITSDEGFRKLVSEERTRELLEKMDAISEGKLDAGRVIEELFEEFRDAILEKLARSFCV